LRRLTDEQRRERLAEVNAEMGKLKDRIDGLQYKVELLRSERRRLLARLSDPRGVPSSGIDTLYIKNEDLRPVIEEWASSVGDGAYRMLAHRARTTDRLIRRVRLAPLEINGRHKNEVTTLRVADRLLIAMGQHDLIHDLVFYRRIFIRVDGKKVLTYEEVA